MLSYTWTDLLIHLLAVPIYLILGTLRHELSHAFAATIQGLTVTKISVTPSRRDGKWYWGYVQWTSGLANNWTLLAPYLCALLFLVGGIAGYSRVLATCSFHYLAVFAVIFIISPVVDTAYNIAKWLISDRGDFARAFSKEQG